MDSKSINNFVINIKASYIINTFLYDYIDMKGYLDDIKEDSIYGGIPAKYLKGRA